jgi:hypothetical protein
MKKNIILTVSLAYLSAIAQINPNPVVLGQDLSANNSGSSNAAPLRTVQNGTIANLSSNAISAGTATNALTAFTANYATNSGFVINPGKFPTLFSAMRTNNQQIQLGHFDSPTILLVGDSLIANKAPDLETVFRSTIGDNGIGLTSAATYTGSAYQTNSDFGNWLSGQYNVVPSGSTVTFDNDGAGTSIFADRVRVVYETRPDLGNFTIQVSTNGGSFTTYVTTNATINSGYPLGIATADCPVQAGPTRVRVTATSGTVNIIGVIFEHHLMHGAVLVSAAIGGKSWTDFSNTPPVILSNIVTSLGVKLIICEETSDATFGNWGGTAQNILQTLHLAHTNNPDLLVIFPNPFSDPTQEATNVLQIPKMKEFVLTNTAGGNVVGWDDHTYFGNATLEAQHAFMFASDSPHLNSFGRQVSIGAMMELTGLNSLCNRESKNNALIYYGVNGDTPPGIYNLSNLGDAQWVVGGTQTAQLILGNPKVASGGSMWGGLYTDASGNVIFIGPGGAHIITFDGSVAHLNQSFFSDSAFGVTGTLTATNVVLNGTNTWNCSTNTLPASASVVVGWMPITNNGVRLFMPLYK